MTDSKQVRINELARELEIKAKVLIDYLPEIGVTEKKTHSSSIDIEHAELARKHFRGLAAAEAAAEGCEDRGSESEDCAPGSACCSAVGSGIRSSGSETGRRQRLRHCARAPAAPGCSRCALRQRTTAAPAAASRTPAVPAAPGDSCHRRLRPQRGHPTAHPTAAHPTCGTARRRLRGAAAPRPGMPPAQRPAAASPAGTTPPAYCPTGAPPTGQRFPVASRPATAPYQNRPGAPQGMRPAAAPGQIRPEWSSETRRPASSRRSAVEISAAAWRRRTSRKRTNWQPAARRHGRRSESRTGQAALRAQAPRSRGGPRWKSDSTKASANFIRCGLAPASASRPRRARRAGRAGPARATRSNDHRRHHGSRSGGKAGCSRQGSC